MLRHVKLQVKLLFSRVNKVIMSVFCLYIYCIGPAGECAGQQPSERAGGGEGAEEGEDPGRGGHNQ